METVRPSKGQNAKLEGTLPTRLRSQSCPNVDFNAGDGLMVGTCAGITAGVQSFSSGGLSLKCLDWGTPNTAGYLYHPYQFFVGSLGPTLAGTTRKTYRG